MAGEQARPLEIFLLRLTELYIPISVPKLFREDAIFQKIQF
jgi:hypothetical protein